MNYIGQRVQLHAATDHWMRGDRFGEIVGYGRKRQYTDGETVTMVRPIRVKLDKSGKTVRLHPDWAFPIY